MSDATPLVRWKRAALFTIASFVGGIAASAVIAIWAPQSLDPVATPGLEFSAGAILAGSAAVLGGVILANGMLVVRWTIGARHLLLGSAWVVVLGVLHVPVVAFLSERMFVRLGIVWLAAIPLLLTLPKLRLAGERSARRAG